MTKPANILVFLSLILLPSGIYLFTHDIFAMCVAYLTPALWAAYLFSDRIQLSNPAVEKISAVEKELELIRQDLIGQAIGSRKPRYR